MTLLRRSLQEKPHAVGDIEESVLLSKYTEQRRPSQSSSTQETRPPATMVSPVTELETSAEQGSAITRTLWSAIAPQASIAEDSAQSLEDGTIDLQTRCNCGCHRLAYRSSSLMYITTFGQIVIGAPEDAPCEATCNEYTCRVRSRVVLTATYYLPSWLISKAIILAWVRTPYGNPSFGLRVRNLIPEHSPLISAITEGRIHDIQAIFEQRVFSPDDMEQMGWTTLTVRLRSPKPWIRS